ncbi:MAG: HesA/MoeB/ThiF family protein [archaeon]|nr:HesA/MoeB/ThiF family protein [archaeon]
MDADVVELSNLHRQVIHSEAAVGSMKTHSAARSMQRINSRVTIQTHDALITPQNALAIAAEYDVLIDCTDSLPSHYLLSDVSVLQRKPLVSASALQTYAQLYTFIPGRLTPCYRCLYPLTNHSSAPAPRSCSDAGVLGVVPGIVGSLAALEATKLLLKLPDDDDTLCGRLLLFDATDGARMFKTVALRSRRPDCAVCGDSPSVLPPLQSHHYDLPVACAVMFDPLPPHVELSPREYLEMKEKQASHLLIDARAPVQFQICALPNAINVPLPQLLPYLSASRLDPETPIVFVCRRGISSRQALVSSLRAFPHHPFFHIRGGLEAYATTCDPLFPRY